MITITIPSSDDTRMPAETGAAGGQLELLLAPAEPEPRPGNVPASRPPHPVRPGRPRPPRRPGRMGGAARWWFARMREVVRTAREWPVAEEAWAGAEQTTLALPVSAPPPPAVRFARPAPEPGAAAWAA